MVTILQVHRRNNAAAATTRVDNVDDDGDCEKERRRTVPSDELQFVRICKKREEKVVTTEANTSMAAKCV